MVKYQFILYCFHKMRLLSGQDKDGGAAETFIKGQCGLCNYFNQIKVDLQNYLIKRNLVNLINGYLIKLIQLVKGTGDRIPKK